MSSLPARMKKIQLKMKALECSQDFSHYRSMGIFPDTQGQLTPQSMVGSGRNFEFVRDFMVVLVTCKNEDDPIKNQGQITLESVMVSSQNLNQSKLSCMYLLPARMKMIQSKMKEVEWSQHFSHYKSKGIFQDTQGQRTPQSLIRSG